MNLNTSIPDEEDPINARSHDIIEHIYIIISTFEGMVQEEAYFLYIW